MPYSQQKLNRVVERQRAAARGMAPRGAGQTGELHVSHSIPPELFHNAGQQNGYECWDDQGYVNDMARMEPSIRVPYAGKIMVGGRGAGLARPRNRFGVVSKRFVFNSKSGQVEQVA